VPARKKQPPDAGAPLATGRKKTTTRAAESLTAGKKRRAPAPNGAGGGGGGKYDLVIVESPKKAQTINKYLGPNYRVLASYGHVRDLPKRRRKGEEVAGVDIDAGWKPSYVVVEREAGRGKGGRGAREILAELKKAAGAARYVLLATDPDREGEAIAWHIEDALGLDDARTFRIAFNEITRSAVTNALNHAGKINMDRVRAQEARRILDRVVGYPLSNLLSRKVARRSSAGRVQSVALRLVVDREREIEAFKPQEFWKITALLAPAGTVKIERRPLSVVRAKAADKDKEEAEGDGKERLPEAPEGTFFAQLAEWAGKKFGLHDKVVSEWAGNETAALAVAQALDTARYEVLKVEQKDTRENPQPPFTTSTLQRTASNRLHFTGERTMRAAQRLYEGVDLGPDGSVALITYMRTDSTRVSGEALDAVRGYIQGHFGNPYLPDKPNYYASGKSAQEAHEAIRPTDLSYTPERVARLGLHGDLLRLYTLIFQRFVASQMTPAVFAVTKVEVKATPTQPELALAAGGEWSATGLFRASGRVMKFDGYRRVLAPHKQEDAVLPPLHTGQDLDRLDLVASQHSTKPPPRYTEASLIGVLEKEGIGRPSTYAPIIGKITSEERGYIEVRDRKFYATEVGKLVTDLLVEHFKRVMDLKFTSHFEEELDDIETGKIQYTEVLNEFWGEFSQLLRAAEEKMPSKRGVETGEMCPRCGRPLVRNYSKKTKREFVGCSGFREGCKYIKPAEGEPERPEPVQTEHACPTCGRPMVLRMGRSGQFLGCSGYPECKTTMNIGEDGQPVLSAKPTEHTCEKCGRPMVLREGRRGPFLACTGYPKCKNAKDVDAEGKPLEPIDSGIKCEKCGSPMTVKRGPRGPFLGCSAFPKCRSTKPLPEEMKGKMNLPAAPPRKPAPAVEVSETCPECGSAMKLRQGKRGWFLGCSKYPRCKGVREASAELLEQLAEMGAPS
jgi:DNA topoisomerase-1